MLSLELNLSKISTSEKAGIYFEMGSSRKNFPSSQSIRTAKEVMALDIEAILKISLSLNVRSSSGLAIPKDF